MVVCPSTGQKPSNAPCHHTTDGALSKKTSHVLIEYGQSKAPTTAHKAIIIPITKSFAPIIHLVNCHPTRVSTRPEDARVLPPLLPGWLVKLTLAIKLRQCRNASPKHIIVPWFEEWSHHPPLVWCNFFLGSNRRRQKAIVHRLFTVMGKPANHKIVQPQFVFMRPGFSHVFVYVYNADHFANHNLHQTRRTLALLLRRLGLAGEKGRYITSQSKFQIHSVI